MDLSEIDTIDLLAELDRRSKLDAPPAVEFFGVWPGEKAGHYLVGRHGQHLSELRTSAAIGRRLEPWVTSGLQRTPEPQTEGKLWHWHHRTEAITMLLSWDRSADHRGGCCASFIIRAHVTPERAMDLARSTFPLVFERIEAHLGGPTGLAGPVPTVDT